MLRVLVVLTVVSGILYFVLSAVSWRRSKRRAYQLSELPPPAYFWGFLFSVLFYYGFPLWWWRYGFRKALHLMIVCIGAGVLIQALLRAIDVIEIEGIGESIAIGLLIAVPIRAIAGLWVARQDCSWRKAITDARRSRRLQAEASDA